MTRYIRLANFNDNQQFYKFEYQMRRKEMTEEERIKEDVDMEEHIKIETEKIINNRIKLILLITYDIYQIMKFANAILEQLDLVIFRLSRLNVKVWLDILNESPLRLKRRAGKLSTI